MATGNLSFRFVGSPLPTERRSSRWPVTVMVHDSGHIDDGVDSGDRFGTKEHELTRAATDLAGEFPDVPYAVVLELVRQATERYETAIVRTFLPILVAKEVRTQLRSTYLPAQRGPMPVATPCGRANRSDELPAPLAPLR